MSGDSSLYLNIAYSAGVDNAMADFGLATHGNIKEARIGTGKALTEAGLKLAPALDDVGRLTEQQLAQMTKNLDARYITANKNLSDDMLQSFYGNYNGGIRRVGNPAYRDSMRAADDYVNQVRNAVPTEIAGSPYYRTSRFNLSAGNRPLTNAQLARLGVHPGTVVAHPVTGSPIAFANLTQAEARVLLGSADDALGAASRQAELAAAQARVAKRSVKPPVKPQAPPQTAPQAPPQTAQQPAGLNNPNAQMNLFPPKTPPPPPPKTPPPQKTQPASPSGNTQPANPSGNTQPANPAGATKTQNPAQPAAPTAPNTKPSFGARFGVPLAVGGLAAGAAGAGGYMYGSRHQDRPFRNIVRHYTGF